MSAPTMGEHKGDGIRYEMHLSAPKGGLAQMLRDPDGQWVAYRDYAALQAEKEAETKATFDAIRLITQLRDENERLTRLLLDLSNAVHIHRANANGSKCDAEINRIVAEVDTIFDIQ